MIDKSTKDAFAVMLGVLCRIGFQPTNHLMFDVVGKLNNNLNDTFVLSFFVLCYCGGCVNCCVQNSIFKIGKLF